MCNSGCYICIDVCTAFCKELPTETEFDNFVNHYAVAMKKYSSYVSSGFENSFRNDCACLLCSKIFQV